MKDHPIGHNNVVCQDRWSLMAVVFQDKFHCIAVNANTGVGLSYLSSPWPVDTY